MTYAFEEVEQELQVQYLLKLVDLQHPGHIEQSLGPDAVVVAVSHTVSLVGAG